MKPRLYTWALFYHYYVLSARIWISFRVNAINRVLTRVDPTHFNWIGIRVEIQPGLELLCKHGYR
jgi:hypothetical protein